MRLQSRQDAAELAEFLEDRLSQYGRRLNAIVNYDNFTLDPAAAQRYWEMVRHNTATYFHTLTRYSTNAFYRHQLREHFAGAHLEQRIYPSFNDAKAHLAPIEQLHAPRVPHGSDEPSN